MPGSVSQPDELLRRWIGVPVGRQVLGNGATHFAVPATKAVGGFLTFDVIVKNIRAMGVESTVLGTDFGQTANIHPVLAMQEYIQRLQEAGFKEKEIETMAIKNPKALLGV